MRTRTKAFCRKLSKLSKDTPRLVAAVDNHSNRRYVKAKLAYYKTMVVVGLAMMRKASNSRMASGSGVQR